MKVKDSVILGGMFLFLLVFYVLQLTVFKPDENSFRTQLTHFDSDSIDRFELRIGDHESVLIKQDNKWNILQNGKYFSANQALIDTFLIGFSHLKTILLVTRDSLEWKEYGVDPAKGKLITFYQGDSMVDQLIPGDTGFNREAGDSYAYFRLKHENETYSVHPRSAFFIPIDKNTFRHQKLLEFNPSDLHSLLLVSGDQEEVIQKNLAGQWHYNTLPIDSFSMKDYLAKLSHLSAKSFYDHFDAGRGFGVIQSLQLNKNLQVDCYLDEKGFVLKSTQNDSYFLSDSSGLYQDVFTDLENILIDAAKK